jgi:hypothetical protein
MERLKEMTQTMFIVCLFSVVIAYAGGAAVGWWIRDSLIIKRAKPKDKKKNNRLPRQRRRR